ncbi:hypothetical protein Leryth_022286 [Lithospermum erythrorhizon]|nr:hypothetical protein Leryth_022286 [Lithospermum erythrorhizon]
MDQEKGVSVDQTNEKLSKISVQECTSMTHSDEHQVDNSFGTKGLNLDDLEKGVSVDQKIENSSAIVGISVQESSSMMNSDEDQVDNSFGTKELNLDDKDKGVLLDQTNENPSVIFSIVVEESTSMKSSDEHQADNSFGTKGSNLDDPVKADENERCGSCIVNLGDENGEKMGDFGSQQLCRICHLSALESGKSLVDLIVLGCGCKGDIAFAHSHCAEAWFKLKGNRICEICGEHANNITGAVDIRFMEEWNENRSIVDSERRGCWQSQPLCNFLMACLMIAFVLPWFFRVNMF